MKHYSNSPRKPMMYGGESRMKRNSGSTGQGETRAKADAAANAGTQSRLATGRATSKDKELAQQQRRETLRREIKKAKEDGDMAKMQKFKKEASGTGSEAMIIRGILQDMGMAGRSSGDKEPTGKMYGGMAGKKKMAMGGKPMAKDPKTGKMKPTYAMDGKGKMMYGGKTKKK